MFFQMYMRPYLSTISQACQLQNNEIPSLTVATHAEQLEQAIWATGDDGGALQQFRVRYMKLCSHHCARAETQHGGCRSVQWWQLRYGFMRMWWCGRPVSMLRYKSYGQDDAADDLSRFGYG